MPRQKTKPIPEETFDALFRAIRDLQNHGQAMVNGKRFPHKILDDSKRGKAFLTRQRHGLVMETMLVRGLRFNELASMRRDQLSLKPPSIHVHRSKKGENGSAPVPQLLARRLDSWHFAWHQLYSPKTSELLFPNRNGQQLGIRIYNDMLRSFADLFDELKLSSHCFRDTAAVKIIAEDGMSIVDVGRFLGHRSSVSTEQYIRKKQLQDVQLRLPLWAEMD
jgi:integrase